MGVLRTCTKEAHARVTKRDSEYEDLGASFLLKPERDSPCPLQLAYDVMANPKKRSNDSAGRQLNDRMAWTVIGVIVACVTVVLWLPLIKQVAG